MRSKIGRGSAGVIGAVLIAAASGVAWIDWRPAPASPTIAFIPQTAGAMLWDVEHLGAKMAAEKLKSRLYWNAPTSETDVAGQVSLIDKVARGKYQGLVVAPNHRLAILAPLQRALAAGLPVVIVSSPLNIPARGKLGYIVNDDEEMGELAAAEIAKVIHGQGSIALVGLALYAPGVQDRVRGAERYMASRFPGITVADRLAGTYNTPFAEELTLGALDSHPELKAVLSFTAASTRGVHAALKSRSLEKVISLVGCEQDSDLIGYVGGGEIVGVVAENTYRMGYEALGLISAFLTGKPLPAFSVIPPLLITKHNFNSPAAGLFTKFLR